MNRKRTQGNLRYPAAAFLLLALILIGYFPALSTGFNGDDYHYLKQCALSKNYINNIVGYFAQGRVFYRPIAMATFDLCCIIGGYNPLVFHLFNLFVHYSACLLLCLLAYRISGNLSAAVLGAVVFAVYPIHTEVVTWISGRFYSLCLLFVLTACLLVLKQSRYTLGRVAAINILFVCALMSHELAAVFPVVALCLLVLVKGNRLTQVLRRRGHLALILSLFCSFLLYFAVRYLLMGGRLGGYYREGTSVLADTLSVAAWKTLFTIHIPRLLSPFAPIRDVYVPMALAGVVLLFFCLSRRAKCFVLWMVLFWLPVLHLRYEGSISIPQAERFDYIPAAGLAVLIALLTHWLLVRLKGIKHLPAKRIAALCLCLFVLVLCLRFESLLVAKNRDWQQAGRIAGGVLRGVKALLPHYNGSKRVYLKTNQYEHPFRRDAYLPLDCYKGAYIFRGQFGNALQYLYQRPMPHKWAQIVRDFPEYDEKSLYLLLRGSTLYHLTAQYAAMRRHQAGRILLLQDARRFFTNGAYRIPIRSIRVFSAVTVLAAATGETKDNEAVAAIRVYKGDNSYDIPIRGSDMVIDWAYKSYVDIFEPAKITFQLKYTKFLNREFVTQIDITPSPDTSLRVTDIMLIYSGVR